MSRTKAKASVIDMKYATLIGTPDRLREYFAAMGELKASVVDLKFCNIVILDDAITRDEIAQALETTPRVQEA